MSSLYSSARFLRAALILLALSAAASPTWAQSASLQTLAPDLRAVMLYAEPVGTAMVLRSSTRPDTVDVLPDPWLGRDKALHAGGSFLFTLSAQYVLTSKLDASSGTGLPIAAGTALALGLAKEIADSRRPVRPLFSTRDLVADAVGVGLAALLIAL